ncbi:MAG: hypothetical protein ABIV48_00950 [Pyrinomonadaceae bacterium]
MNMQKVFSSKNFLKWSVVAVVLAAMSVLAYSNRNGSFERVEASTVNTDTLAASRDPEKAVAAFNDAVKVFFSARCANCHPGGDIPTQGDDMTLHTQGVTRGKDGKGVYGMTCTTCHQNENLPGFHLPPGTNKDWHMPPADQPMVFQGLTAGQLCRNFKDPKKNGGHKTLRGAMDHIQKKDPLVMWAWEPGNGRTLPPMSFADFSAKIEEWVASGGDCPK